MPWNNQSGGGGGWKSGGGGGGGGGGPWGQGPWGQGPGGGKQPDLDELLKRSQDRLKQVMPQGSGVPGPLIALAAAAVLAVAVFYGFFFTVKPNQLGIVLRFGEFVRQEPPGLHFRLPYPIEEVIVPDVTGRRQIRIGMPGASGRGIRDTGAESLMLTGDENIVDVDFVVIWRIKSAENYLFAIQNPQTTVKEVAESAMREVVGKNDIQPILTGARQKTEAAVQELMQRTLDSYKAGIEITQVQLQKVDPPAKVIAAFRDVQAARADQERLQNEARAYANRIVPEARGEAERILQGAQAYREQTVAEATGQASRFEKVYEEYRKAPDVTRKRIFLETMEKIFSGTDKIILDQNAGQGAVPYLPLGELTRKPKSTQ
ncbi:MAG: FtsH protease activity modulator HflK [Hyphomicrobiaceae bacterium]